MKYLLIPFALLLVHQLDAQSLVHGRINNLNNRSDTAFKIVFIQKNVRRDSTWSKAAGFYTKQAIAGLYDLEFSKPGHVPVVLKALYFNNGDISINFSLKFTPIPPKTVEIETAHSKADAGMRTDSLRIVTPTYSLGAGAPGITSHAYAPPASYSTKSIALAPTSVTRSVAKSKGSGSGAGKGSSTPVKRKVVSHAKSESIGLDKESEVMETSAKELTVKDEDASNSTPRAGQVTAGHWRDIDHWSDWEKTNKKEDINKLQNTWGYYPKNMMKIAFEDREGKAMAFTSVALLGKDGNSVWQTRTDQDGYAYFWPGIFGSGKEQNYSIRIYMDGREKTIDKIETYINSTNKVKVDMLNHHERRLEIGFVVDATGSMGDEIRFLQVELMDVINRVQKKNPCLSLQTGCVFYKDHGDEYVTRVLPLSDNPANALDFIANQNVNGGGDFPEAVDVAMQDALTQLNWSETDNPRIMFLLLDAPPHQDSASKARMRQYTRIAAEKGIRIVPIAASGIDKATEFLLKYMAIATNGEYVYITDDSKIGNSHLKPTGGESKVEYLNDLMVDIISKYSEGKWCKQQRQEEIAARDSTNQVPVQYDSLQQKPNHTEIISGNNWYMKFYPNPAANFLQVQFSEQAERIRITDMNGKVMFEAENKQETALDLDISSWGTGVYLVYAVRKEETITGKLLVMH